MKTAEELLMKLQRLSDIPIKTLFVKGNPRAIQTVIINGEPLMSRWSKRIYKLKINLIEQYAKTTIEEIMLEELCPKCKHKDRPDYNCDLCEGFGYINLMKIEFENWIYTYLEYLSTLPDEKAI